MCITMLWSVAIAYFVIPAYDIFVNTTVHIYDNPTSQKLNTKFTIILREHIKRKHEKTENNVLFNQVCLDRFYSTDVSELAHCAKNNSIYSIWPLMLRSFLIKIKKLRWFQNTMSEWTKKCIVRWGEK